MGTGVQGIKGVMPAILILALAYTINTITQNLGAAEYVVKVTEGWLNAHLLPILIFIIAAFISFATGTAWGTYAILIPIAVPMAFTYSGGGLTMLVYATIAAVASGGVFGDHCSPLSDTTILSSLGASSDHIDHVKTQIPYAFTCAFVALICYLFIGFIF